MIKGILIDIDNTLYNYEKAHAPAIFAVKQFMEDYAPENKFTSCYEQARKSVHKELNDTASSHNRLLYFQKTLENLEIGDFLLAKKMYDIYWNVFLENIKLYDGAVEFLKMFNKENLCFVTDLTAYIQYRKIEKFGLNEFVGNIVTSEEAGVEKPNKKIFEMAIKKIKLPLNEICMIGDSYEKDYLGAKNFGIKAFLFNPKQEDFSFDIVQYNSYYELAERLKNE